MKRLPSIEGGGARDPLLTAQAAPALLQRIVRHGTVAWSLRALDCAHAAGITTVECGNAMLSGVADPADVKGGSRHYRIHSPRLSIVLGFRSDDEVVVVDVARRSR